MFLFTLYCFFYLWSFESFGWKRHYKYKILLLIIINYYHYYYDRPGLVWLLSACSLAVLQHAAGGGGATAAGAGPHQPRDAPWRPATGGEHSGEPPPPPGPHRAAAAATAATQRYPADSLAMIHLFLRSALPSLSADPGVRRSDAPSLNLMLSFLSVQNSLTLQWTESHELGPRRTRVYVRAWVWVCMCVCVCLYHTRTCTLWPAPRTIHTQEDRTLSFFFCFCFKTKLSPCVIVLWSMRNCWRATL